MNETGSFNNLEEITVKNQGLNFIDFAGCKNLSFPKLKTIEGEIVFCDDYYENKTIQNIDLSHLEKVGAIANLTPEIIAELDLRNLKDCGFLSVNRCKEFPNGKRICQLEEFKQKFSLIGKNILARQKQKEQERGKE